MASLNLVTAATGNALSLRVAKEHCRVDLDDEDALFGEHYIPEAAQDVEILTRRQLLTATYDAGFDAWACWLELPKPPLQSVVHVKYVDPAGVTQTLDPCQYRVQSSNVPTGRRARIYPAPHVTWPVLQCQPDAVIVRFVAGYGTAAQIPPKLRVAMMLRLSCRYEKRKPTVAESRALARYVSSFVSHSEQRS